MRVALPVAALMLVCSSAAVAEDARPVEHVEYRDLDLRTDKGVKRLRARVRYAAIAVCERNGYFRIGPSWEPGATECHLDAMASAEPRLQLAVSTAREARLASVDVGSFGVGRGR